MPDAVGSPLDKISDRLNISDPGIKFNKNRRGSVSAESMKPTTEEPNRVVIPKRCVTGGTGRVRGNVGPTLRAWTGAWTRVRHSNEARLRIAAAISQNLLFRNLDRDQRQEVVRGLARSPRPRPQRTNALSFSTPLRACRAVGGRHV